MQRRERWHRYWDKHSKSYDREMGVVERVLLKDSRAWVCSQAVGDTLEVGIGTGLNLAHYPAEVTLAGIDLSDAMLEVARHRSRALGRSVDLRQADAASLPFGDDTFDTVVCTFSLCAIPDDRGAIGEIARVLQPGGRLLLADHIAGASFPVRCIQHLLELVTGSRARPTHAMPARLWASPGARHPGGSTPGVLQEGDSSPRRSTRYAPSK